MCRGKSIMFVGVITAGTGVPNRSAKSTPVAGMAGWVPVTGPLGLGLSIVSYAGQLSVGLASDAHLLPDHDRLLALLDDEIGALHTPTALSRLRTQSSPLPP